MAIINPGDIVWNFMTLINAGGKRADILLLCPEVHLFEDMFSTHMHGWALVQDTESMIDSFPIIGQEELYISYQTPGYDQIMDKKFRVTGVTERYMEGNKQTYKLNFISYDAYADQTMNETRAFEGTASESIPKIIKNLQDQSDRLSYSKVKPKLNMGAQSSNTSKFVSPSWSPMKCVTWLANNAVSQKHRVADYMFWENRDGYQFKSLTEQFDTEPVDVFKWDASTGETEGKRDVGEQMAKIRDIDFAQVSDQLTRLAHGGYGGKTITHDIFSKHLKVENLYNPRNKQLTLPMLNKFDVSVVNDKEFTAWKSNYNVRIADSNSLAHNNIINDNAGVVVNTKDLIWSRLAFAELNIEVWGRSWVTVGDVVYIGLGSYAQSKNETEEQESGIGSGRYLVTAIHHLLAPLQHKMVMQCIKDSNISAITV